MKNNERDIFFVALLTILGMAVRLSGPLSASFPLNDGGLFYQMIVDLQNNNFILPAVTTYNFAEIPFAYPPFAFYVYGLFSASGIPLLKLMQFLPALVTTFTIPAFYVLAKDLLNNKQQSLFGTMAFALLPRTFDWLIMGGGVTRSLGFLFAILAIHQAFLLFTIPTSRNLILTTLYSSLVVVTHPEAAVHTIIAAIFIFIWKDHTLKGIFRAGAVAFGTLILSAPWWMTILIKHGMAPLQAAQIAAQENSVNFILRIFTLIKFDLTDEPFMQVLAVIGLIGIFILLAQRKPALPIWFVLIALIEPRGGTLYMMLPLAMFIGVTFDQAILPILKPQGDNSHAWAWNAFIGFFLLYGVINASVTASNITRQLTLTPSDLDAFAWVKANTPPDSQFILITQGLPLNDSTSEWFPVMAERPSLATVFGYEWVNDDLFGARVEQYQKLQTCMMQDTACLNQWAQRYNQELSYIYLQKSHGDTSVQPPLYISLINSPEFKSIFNSENIEIFIKK